MQVEQVLKELITNGSYGPVSELLHLWLLGMQIAENSVTEG
jgi:hypothetical protein